MKKNFTLLLTFAFLVALAAKAQTCIATNAPTLILKNPVYITGTGTGAGTLNAQYRFSNVSSLTPATTDVIVTLTALVNAQLSNIDDDASNPGTANNFQPVVTSNANANGYVLFDFKFVTAGTTNSFLQTCINFTAVDIDGATGLKEKVSVFDVSGGQLGSPTNLIISKNGNETTIVANNTGCNGICTNPENVCNFGKVNSNNIVFSFGSDNTTNAAVTRYGSFQFSPYFATLLVTFPVQFGTLQIVSGNNSNTLNWNTYTESALQKFVVERSFDGIHFESVAILAPKNNNNDNQYSFTDPLPVNGTKTFYRIKAVELKGKEIFSAIVKTQSVSSNNNMVVYPNPVKTQGFISYNSKFSGTARIKIVAASGAILKTTAIQLVKGMNVFPLNHAVSLKEGTYMVILSQSNAILGTGKLIIQ